MVPTQPILTTYHYKEPRTTTAHHQRKNHPSSANASVSRADHEDPPPIVFTPGKGPVAPLTKDRHVQAVDHVKSKEVAPEDNITWININVSSGGGEAESKGFGISSLLR